MCHLLEKHQKIRLNYILKLNLFLADFEQVILITALKFQTSGQTFLKMSKIFYVTLLREFN